MFLARSYQLLLLRRHTVRSVVRLLDRFGSVLESLGWLGYLFAAGTLTDGDGKPMLSRLSYSMIDPFAWAVIRRIYS